MATPEYQARRAFLQGALVAPAALTVASCPSTAFAGLAETAIGTMFREWATYFTWVNTTEDRFTWDDAEWDARFAVLDEIENRIEAETATSLHDLALKYAAISSFGCVDLTNTRDFEVQTVLGLAEV